MSMLANTEGYYLEYTMIVKNLVKVGDNPDMSEEHLVGMIDDILWKFPPNQSRAFR